MKSLRPLLRLGGLLSILALGGCSTLTPATTSEVRPKTKVVVGSFRPIPPKTSWPCDAQKAVAEHNAIYDSIRFGKAVKYVPACEQEGKTS